MNHKRKRPKNQRSGCLMCKPHKVNGHGKDHPEHESHSAHVSRQAASEEIEVYNNEKDDHPVLKHKSGIVWNDPVITCPNIPKMEYDEKLM